MYLLKIDVILEKFIVLIAQCYKKLRLDASMRLLVTYINLANYVYITRKAYS